MKYANKDKNVI
jgi:hypothetical protein